MFYLLSYYFCYSVTKLVARSKINDEDPYLRGSIKVPLYWFDLHYLN